MVNPQPPSISLVPLQKEDIFVSDIQGRQSAVAKLDVVAAIDTSAELDDFVGGCDCRAGLE
jgi:hypothetical protein